MIFPCSRCDAVVSDEGNDYELTADGHPICESCIEELEIQNWWSKTEESHERTN